MSNNDNLIVSFIISLFLHLLSVFFLTFSFNFKNSKSLDEKIFTVEILPIDKISNLPNILGSIPENQEKKSMKKPSGELYKESLVKSNMNNRKKLEDVKSNSNNFVNKSNNLNSKVSPVKEEGKFSSKVEEKPSKRLKLEEVNSKRELDSLLKNLQQEVKKDENHSKNKLISKSELDSLMKNLQQALIEESSGKKIDILEPNSNKESKGPYNENLPLSITEILLIKKQIEDNWVIPIGARGIEQVKITLNIFLKKDGSVSDIKVKKVFCGGVSNNICQAMIDSTCRAVMQASPLKYLPTENYESWKEFYFNFDPSEMLK